MGAFWGTRLMEIVKKHDAGGLVWKRIKLKLTSTRKANAEKRLLRVWQDVAARYVFNPSSLFWALVLWAS
ncbi:hypothetical protein RJT34_18789 [Clitoria ternatea]|uniref:Uncharacterized protein n=1 Tax=Clitoria ternatea TaxID=43366 RepID=A0AAN9JBG2_CLITE